MTGRRGAARAAWVATDATSMRPLAVHVEPATSFVARLVGLMGRPALSDGHGLWLPGGNGIHMLFMRFPIDCVFLSRADDAGLRRIVALRRALPPWRGIVPFVRGADGALELPVGAIDAARAAVGHLVELRPGD